MSFAVGSLVRARGREWVVLPESETEPDTLILRPLAGTDEEVTGIYLPLENVEAATLDPPDPQLGLGNHRSAMLLRDAVRLGFRSSAGPFRCMGRIAIEPRPYQLVPLLMALRLDPVRLLIGDDVGIGKTVEACLIARELLDRGEIQRIAVLCPPHLADQWQRALSQQFHIEAKLVLRGTAARLEREAGLSPHDSLFDHYPHVVVSLDYIKSERRRHEFLRTCPEFVIVDEAHTCAPSGLGRGAQLRHALVSELAADPDRHLLLVTATPHSGREDNFRALLGLLQEKFLELPANLSGEANRRYREDLARHFVQRRRGDIRAYLDTETRFPERLSAEQHYELSESYRKLFDRVLAYCRESVQTEGGDTRRQRVRWWSALALLRSLSSSPRAAAATLRSRASNAEAATPEEADEAGRRAVLDQDDEAGEGLDVAPGSQPDADDGPESAERRRLNELAREVEKLEGKEDYKLKGAAKLLQSLVKEGFAPIVFCRFIPTVEYLREQLEQHLPKGTGIEAVTGNLDPEERERRVEALAEYESRVLVCTDCLSEGINLQHDFDAVVHYDLSWNPTRHEQREGRVDRFGQAAEQVKTVTYYGRDNPLDGIVLDVLLRKHQAIQRQLGISVPVPMDTNAVLEAVTESLLMRGKQETLNQLSFDFVEPHKREVGVQWEAAAEREKQSRTIFAQRTIKVDDVAREVSEAQEAVGDHRAVERFFTEALTSLGARIERRRTLTISVDGLPSAARESVAPNGKERFHVVFEEPTPAHATLLTRTHPAVSGLADYVWNAALDPVLQGPARRCVVIRTDQVAKRTTVFLLRLRHHIVTENQDGTRRPLLAEEARVTGFEGSPTSPAWLGNPDAEALLDATPSGNVAPELARDRIDDVRRALGELQSALEQLAKDRAERLFEAHHRVRSAARQRVRALRVEPHLPVDVLGLFVYLPGGNQ